jgi:hypothetical protein
MEREAHPFELWPRSVERKRAGAQPHKMTASSLESTKYARSAKRKPDRAQLQEQTAPTVGFGTEHSFTLN